MPVVVVYDFFPISIRVWRQIGVENGPFLVFEKNQKSLKRVTSNIIAYYMANCMDIDKARDIANGILSIEIQARWTCEI